MLVTDKKSSEKIATVTEYELNLGRISYFKGFPVYSYIIVNSLQKGGGQSNVESYILYSTIYFYHMLLYS